MSVFSSLAQLPTIRERIGDLDVVTRAQIDFVADFCGASFQEAYFSVISAVFANPSKYGFEDNLKNLWQVAISKKIRRLLKASEPHSEKNSNFVVKALNNFCFCVRYFRQGIVYDTDNTDLRLTYMNYNTHESDSSNNCVRYAISMLLNMIQTNGTSGEKRDAVNFLIPTGNTFNLQNIMTVLCLIFKFFEKLSVEDGRCFFYIPDGGIEKDCSSRIFFSLNIFNRRAKRYEKVALKLSVLLHGFDIGVKLSIHTNYHAREHSGFDLESIRSLRTALLPSLISYLGSHGVIFAMPGERIHGLAYRTEHLISDISFSLKFVERNLGLVNFEREIRYCTCDFVKDIIRKIEYFMTGKKTPRTLWDSYTDMLRIGSPYLHNRTGEYSFFSPRLPQIDKKTGRPIQLLRHTSSSSSSSPELESRPLFVSIYDDFEKDLEPVSECCERDLVVSLSFLESSPAPPPESCVFLHRPSVETEASPKLDFGGP